MPPNFKTGTVIYNQNPATTYHDVVVETDEHLEFKAGQYISIKVADARINAYSIAGKLDGNKIGLIVDSKPGGPGSQYFANLKAGDRMEFIGPLGNFFIHPEDDVDKVILLSTGSGIAPIKAIAEAYLREVKTDIPLYMYFGLRFEEDIFWDDYFKDLSEQYPNFHFTFCLSKPSDSWQGKSGHITDHIIPCLPDGNQDFSKSSVYICGNQHMIDESIELLKSNGMPEEHIYHEKFF